MYEFGVTTVRNGKRTSTNKYTFTTVLAWKYELQDRPMLGNVVYFRLAHLESITYKGVFEHTSPSRIIGIILHYLETVTR